jgi:hypothetical protein
VVRINRVVGSMRWRGVSGNMGMIWGCICWKDGRMEGWMGMYVLEGWRDGWGN